VYVYAGYSLVTLGMHLSSQEAKHLEKSAAWEILHAHKTL
jgi:hypothetical protein